MSFNEESNENKQNQCVMIHKYMPTMYYPYIHGKYAFSCINISRLSPSNKPIPDQCRYGVSSTSTLRGNIAASTLPAIFPSKSALVTTQDTDINIFKSFCIVFHYNLDTMFAHIVMTYSTVEIKDNNVSLTDDEILSILEKIKQKYYNSYSILIPSFCSLFDYFGRINYESMENSKIVNLLLFFRAILCNKYITRETIYLNLIRTIIGKYIEETLKRKISTDRFHIIKEQVKANEGLYYSCECVDVHKKNNRQIRMIYLHEEELRLRGDFCFLFNIAMRYSDFNTLYMQHNYSFQSIYDMYKRIRMDFVIYFRYDTTFLFKIWFNTMIKYIRTSNLQDKVSTSINIYSYMNHQSHVYEEESEYTSTQNDEMKDTRGETNLYVMFFKLTIVSSFDKILIRSMTNSEYCYFWDNYNALSPQR